MAGITTLVGVSQMTFFVLMCNVLKFYSISCLCSRNYPALPQSLKCPCLRLRRPISATTDLFPSDQTVLRRADIFFVTSTPECLQPCECSDQRSSVDGLGDERTRDVSPGTRTILSATPHGRPAVSRGVYFETEMPSRLPETNVEIDDGGEQRPRYVRLPSVAV